MGAMPARHPEDGDATSWVDVEDAARLCGRSPETIRRWARAGVVPARRQGRRLVLSRASLPVAQPDAVTSLADWARMARRHMAEEPGGAGGGSAADLVLADRRRRGDRGA